MEFTSSVVKRLFGLTIQSLSPVKAPRASRVRSHKVMRMLHRKSSPRRRRIGRARPQRARHEVPLLVGDEAKTIRVEHLRGASSGSIDPKRQLRSMARMLLAGVWPSYLRGLASSRSLLLCFCSSSSFRASVQRAYSRLNKRTSRPNYSQGY